MEDGALLTCIVGVVQLGDSFDLAVLHGRALLVELRLGLELDPVEDALHDPTVGGLQCHEKSQPQTEGGEDENT